MSGSNEHSPQHEALLKKQALEQSEVKEVLGFIRKWGKSVLVVVVAVCAFFLVDRFFKSHRIQKEAAADAALTSARTAADFQAIVDDYGSTPSAPIAMIGLAREKFNAGQIDEADALFSQFLKKYPKHELAEQAELNRIACREAKSQLGDAHLLYGEFEQKHKESHLAPVALLGKARCLEALQEYSEAKRVYEDIVTYYPGTTWANMAEGNLRSVSGKL